MNFDDLLLARANRRWRIASGGVALALTVAVGYLHLLSGLAYEFHLFFVIPVLLAAWVVGPLFGYGLAVLAVALWFVADWTLGGDRYGWAPLVFNSSLRLAMFLAAVWAAVRLRSVVEREFRFAREDALTLLPNRREFHDQGRRMLVRAHRDRAPITAMFIDLDRFKEVNDTLGHETGDMLLAVVAQAMRAHLRTSDLAGRLGGDEFALLLPGMAPDAAEAYAKELRVKLLASMRQPGWPVTFSIGIASYQRAPKDFDLLLAQADALMYDVKKAGRDRVLFRAYPDA